MDSRIDNTRSQSVSSAPNLPLSEQTIVSRLRDLPLFSGVDEASLQKLAKALQVRSADRGQVILNKGSVGHHLLLLLSGRLQAVDLTEDGHEIGLSFLMAGDYFGELSVIDGLPRSATVIACAASLYALLPRTQALELMYNNPVVAERVLKRLAANIRRASDFRTILGIPNAFQRVYALLSYLSRTSPGGVVIDSLPTQQEIAIMVNTSRETVSRAFHVLIQRKIVQKDRKRLLVRQPEALRDEMNANQTLHVQQRR